MKEFKEKIKVPVAVIMSAMIIIGVAAAFCAVFEGYTGKVYTVTETVSQIEDGNSDISKLLEFDGTKLYLPDGFEGKIYSLTERKCKTYTEKELKTETGSITVKAYNYAYLIEDDVIKIPDNAEKFSWQGTDIFVFENSDGTSTAVYYKELVRYTVTLKCSADEMMEIF